MAPVLVSRPVLTLADGVADQRCNRVVLLCLQPPPSSAAATLPSHSTCCAPSTCGAHQRMCGFRLARIGPCMGRIGRAEKRGRAGEEG